MYFETFQQALAMGGHGAYVWSAYAVTALVVAWSIVAPLRRRSRILRNLASDRRRARAAHGLTPGRN